MKDIGVLIARLQVLRLTTRQENFYKLTRHRHGEAWIVLIEDPVRGSTRHPFTVEVRQQMIRNVFPEARILSLKESPEASDWSERLESLLRDADGQAEFMLYGTTAALGSRYTGNWKTEEIDPELDSDNAEAADGFNPEVRPDEDFRRGMLYGYRQLYPKVYATVDVAVFRESDHKWLLVRKGYNHKWRFPGGFSDPEDDSFETAALRELKEETGIEATGISYEMSLRVDDWRYRHEDDKITTIFFTARCQAGEGKAMDDIAEIKWVNLSGIKELVQQNQIAEEHRPLFKCLLSKPDRFL